MRKHFLILMLLTLLPLATWAVDIDVKVYAKNVNVTFGVATPDVSSAWFDLSGSSDPDVIDAVAGTLTAQTQRTVSSPVVDGGYDFSLYKTVNKVTVGGNDYYISIGDANAKLFVEKNNTVLAVDPAALEAIATNVYSETTPGTPDDKTLFSGAVSVQSGAADISSEVVYALSETAGTWTANIGELVANQAGNYTLYYKVVETTSHAGLAATAFGGGSIAQAPNTIVDPTAGENFTYDAAAHDLAVAPANAPAFGVIEYSLDEVTWSEDIPTATNVDDPNQVYWRVLETTNYTGQASTALADVTITPATPVITVPAGIQDGWTWDDSEKPLVKGAAQTTFGTILYSYKFKPKNGAWSTSWQGSNESWEANKARQAGDYRVNISVRADNVHSNWVEAFYTVNAARPEFTVALAPATVEVGSEPQAIEGLVYTGDDQPLVTAGTGIGGEMQYSLDGVTYDAAIPEGQDAGGYNVYYKVVGNENHSDLVVAEPVEVNIATAAATLGGYAAVPNLVYNGGNQILLSQTAALANGTARFSFDGGVTWSDTDALPTGKDADTYSILYKVVPANANYHEVVADAEDAIDVTIDQKTITISGAEGQPALEYNAQDQDLLAKKPAYTGQIGDEKAVTFAYTVNEVATAEDALNAKNAGAYTVAWTATLDDNYKTEDAKSGSVNVNIAKKSIGYLLGNKDWTYNGQQATTDGTYAVMAGSFPAGKTLANENIKFEFPGEVINVKEGGYTFGSLTPALLDEEGDDNLGNYSFIFAGNSTVNVLPAAFEPKPEDITFEPATATFAAENITVVPTIAGMTEGTDYTYAVAPATINNAGEYTFTFTGKGNYSDATVEKVFTVAQKNIAADMVQGEDIFDAVTYDGQNHAVAIALKWAKNPEATTEAGKNYVNLVEGTDFDVYVNGEKTLSTEVEAINVGNYVYTIKGIGNYAAQLGGDDYILAINANSEDFADAFSFTEDTWTNKVYNAASQTPAWSTTLADADYTVTVTDGEHILADTKAAALALELKNKGTYTYTFEPTGNYTGEAVEKEFTITPATIAVQAANATKEYNGQDGLAGAEGGELTYSGIKTPDTEAVVIAPENAISVVAVDEQTKNVGEYNLTVNVTDFASVNGNYKFVAANQQGKLTITKKTGVVIAFTDETVKAYGVADEDADLKANLMVAGQIVGEEDAMLADITVTRREGAAYEGENVGTYVNALQINLDEDALPFSNYAINYATNYGTLVIDAPEAIVIALKDETKFNKMYDGQVPADWEVSAEDLIVSGGLANPEPLDPSIITKLPTAKVQNASANVGTYIIKLEGAETVNYPVVAIDGKMVISAKKLAKGSVSIQEQTLQAGTSVDNFATDAYEVKNLVEGEDYTAIWGIKLADAHVAVGKVAGETDAEGIELYVLDAEAAANYEFDAAENLYGRLVVPDAESIFLTRGDRSAEGAAKIAKGANNIFEGDVDGASVEFDDWAMDAKKWYAMVLPFEVDMMQLINAFGGYVSVDVLDDTNTNTDKMNFELHGGIVPAHTPFLIKIYTAKNLNTVKFNDVDVLATQGANTTQTDAAGNELIGTYAGKQFNGDNANCWILSLNSGKWQTASETATVYPLGAYIHTATANARIFVQEEDGTVTEIEGINADGSAVEAGTYYTVNGMKLDKVPTKKGVYVKDGKKVVVK